MPIEESDPFRYPFSARPESWGHPANYFADERVPKHPCEFSEYWGSSERRDQFWAAELHKVDLDAKACVERTFKRSNNLVREHLRAETGLKLNVGEDLTSIPVEVVDGVPPPMAALLDQFADIAPFLLNQPLLRSTVDGLRFLEFHEDYAEAVLDVPPTWDYIIDPPPGGVLTHVRTYAERLISIVSERNAQRSLLAIDCDVMGAYFFRKGRIHLYWMPIAIIAKSLGVSIESLTIIVLAHELAHAYTHRGRDIDGHDWQTEPFAHADLRIVEGFAQHYAEAVCRRLAHREPDLTPTFERLLTQQSEPYTAFKGWIESGSESVRGEIIRSTLIATRHARICDYDEFMPLVMQRSAQIKGVRRT